MNPQLTGIYTLTPTHCGTGQASGAIDLPIARESTSRFPILPSTSLKGVAREAMAGRNGKGPLSAEAITRLFGPELQRVGEPEQKRKGSTDDDTNSRGLFAGELIVGEGHLLCYPLPSLNRTFVYATSPLLIERLFRGLRAHELHRLLPPELERGPDTAKGKRVWVADKALSAADSLVVEDLAFTKDQIGYWEPLAKFGAKLGNLLPEAEGATATRLASGLVLLQDRDLQELIRRVVPVNARVQLTSGKTTDRFGDESGNLWYEESLPSDCLFWCLISQRGGSKSEPTDAKAFATEMAKGSRVQIGGNETVGQGQCLWTTWRA